MKKYVCDVYRAEQQTRKATWLPCAKVARILSAFFFSSSANSSDNDSVERKPPRTRIMQTSPLLIDLIHWLEIKHSTSFPKENVILR